MTDIAAPAPAPARAGFRITGWHVLAGMVLFFTIIISVDVLFMTMAFRSFSGEVASNPYEAGLAYNKTLAEERAQAALGWSTSLQRPSERAVEVTILDRAGRPVSGLAGQVQFERPATRNGSHTLAIKGDSDGIYRATVPEPSGAWDVRFTLSAPDGTPFRVEQRLVWP
jgi:nitrogen fixation protein FixH